MTTALAKDVGCALPLGVHAVASARRFTRDTLVAWEAEEETLRTATLLVSELVTNAVLYGYGARALRLMREGPTLRILVSDDAPGVPHERVPDDESEAGRGLQVVAACATAWGTEPTETGKVVWCEVPFPA